MWVFIHPQNGLCIYLITITTNQRHIGTLFGWKSVDLRSFFGPPCPAPWIFTLAPPRASLQKMTISIFGGEVAAGATSRKILGFCASAAPPHLPHAACHGLAKKAGRDPTSHSDCEKKPFLLILLISFKIAC